MQITASIQKTAGAAVVFSNSAHMRVTDCVIATNLYVGVRLDGGASAFGYHVDNFNISRCTFAGIHIGSQGSATQLPQDVWISDGVMGTCDTGIYIRTVSGLYVSHVDIILGTSGVVTFPSTGEKVTACFFNTVLADSATTKGWNIITNGGEVDNWDMVNCWGSSCSTTGFYVGKGTGVIRSFSITNFRSINNQQRGMFLEGCSGFGFVNCQVLANSQSGSGSYAGLEISGSVCTNITINGGKFGDGWGNVNNQINGIKISAGALNSLAIIGTDCSGNVGVGLSDLSTGTPKTIFGTV